MCLFCGTLAGKPTHSDTALMFHVKLSLKSINTITGGRLIDSDIDGLIDSDSVSEVSIIRSADTAIADVRSKYR